jgi:hypothetical protein
VETRRFKLKRVYDELMTQDVSLQWGSSVGGWLCLWSIFFDSSFLTVSRRLALH